MKKIFIIMSLVVNSAFAIDVDIKKSIVSWRGSKITGDFHEGRIFIKKASLNIENNKITKGSVIVDLKNFTVSDLQGEWATKFLTHMKSEDFFNVEKFPTAKIEIKSHVNNEAKGELTIMGKKQEVSFPMLKFSDKYVGKLIFDRTKFGMIYGSGNFFKNLGDKMINDQVEVDFEIYLKR